MEKGLDVYFWRQCFILFSDCIHCFGVGFYLSFPAALNADILSPNSTVLRATPSQASWIAGCPGITGLIGFCVMPAIMQLFGRKYAHCGIGVCMSSGFIILHFATNITCLYIGRLVQGIAMGGVYITAIILAEYSAPRRRGYFISVMKSAIAIGCLVSHWLSTVYTWRRLALIGCIPGILSIVLTILWPESPAFLAMKGEYEKCETSHTWLHGNSAQSRQQLEELISAQNDRRSENEGGISIRNVWKKISRKDFFKPLFIAMLMVMVVESSGRYYNFAYIVQFMSSITKDKSLIRYYTLCSDLMMIVALWCSCFVIRRFNRRTVLFTCGFCSVILMFSVSCAVYLKNNKHVGPYIVWLPACFIVLNTFMSNFGVIPICFTISGEIFPLQHKGLGTCLTGICFTTIYGIVLKCTPLMIDFVGLEGVYGIYGSILMVCLIIAHIILIETKDKTLQEIENEIRETKVNKDLLLE